jgi:hypothetical protein
MIALANSHVTRPRRPRTRRQGGPHGRVGSTTDSTILLAWLAHQASLYKQVLATIAHAPRPGGRGTSLRS